MDTVVTENILSAAPLLPVWALIAVAAAMVYLLRIQMVSLKERMPESRLPLYLVLARLAVYLLILLTMLNPVVKRLSYLKFLPHVAVLIDDSASMSVDDGGLSRMDRVRTILSGAAWQNLTAGMRDYVFDYYSFGRELKNIGAEGVGPLQAKEDESNISSALAQLAGNYPESQLAGALLFTDGKERPEMKGGDIPAPGETRLVAVGVGSGFKDVRISGARVPDFAFLRKPVNLELELQAHAYKNITSQVILREDGKVVKTQEATFGKGEESRKLSLSLVPESLGQHNISIEVVPQPGEALTENNRTEFVLPVERDKIRILMISGRPSWNYRFLRQALKKDGSIDLISFIILRSPTDPVNVPENQLSLIPFPANALFTEELKNFDLIIFDNFSFRMNLPPSYMENIREAVARGGSFMMIGGDESFYEGGFNQTPIEDILPVVLDEKSAGYVPGSFPFRLTDQGRNHPAMQVSGEADPRQAWSSLPPLSGINRTLRPKPDAVVLGVNGSQSSQWGPLPVIAVMKYGEGRTAALLTDGFWRWNFQGAGLNENNRLYLNMAKQLIRWLVKDPSLEQIRLWGNVIPHENKGRILFRTMTYHPDFSPASDAVLNAIVKYPSGKTARAEYLPGSRPGEYASEVDATEDGVYSFTVEAHARGKLLGRGELKVEYTSAKAELQDAAPDEGLMRSISEASGGKYIRAEEFSSLAPKIPALFSREPKRKLIDQKVEPLLRNLYMFALITSLLSVEWFMRRRRGLV